LGGTEILDPLEAVLKLPTIEEYHRQVFVLTDGAVRKIRPYCIYYILHFVVCPQVSNRDEVISLVQKYSGQARVFALGKIFF